MTAQHSQSNTKRQRHTCDAAAHSQGGAVEQFELGEEAADESRISLSDVSTTEARAGLNGRRALRKLS